jgi:hypothetical protein
MRFRLLRRRLTISAPRMAVRSALPWPFRWIVLALALGFCGAIALWAFEFGRDIAGLDHGAREDLVRMQTALDQAQAELNKLRDERDQAQSIANTAGTLVTSEKAAQEKLAQQVKQLEADNQVLRDDLGFFEKLIPTTGTDSVAIRGLQAEMQNAKQLHWQVLVIQANRNAADFSGRVEIQFSGLLNGKPWTAALPAGPQPIKVKQYGRLEGLFDVPAQAVVKSVTARLIDGNAVRATQSVKL